MKRLFIFLLVLIPVVTFSQTDGKQKENNFNSIFIQSDVQVYDGEFGLLWLTANYERMLKIKSGYIAFSGGGGAIFGIYDYWDVYPTIGLELDGLFGKNHHFLEVGIGGNGFSGNNMVSGFVKSRLGYRSIIDRRIMFRVSCLFFYMPFDSNISPAFSMGFAYRL